MAFDVEAAKQDGYTDEEIQRYLSTKEIPVEEPINRYDETVGTFTSAMPQAAIYAGEGAALGYGAKVLKDAFGNRAPSAPVAPVAPVAANPAVSPSYAAPSAAMPTSTVSAAQSIVQKLALDKLLKNAGAIGAGLSTAQGLFGTSDEEVRIMKEAEARKRAGGWKPLNER